VQARPAQVGVHDQHFLAKLVKATPGDGVTVLPSWGSAEVMTKTLGGRSGVESRSEVLYCGSVREVDSAQ